MRYLFLALAVTGCNTALPVEDLGVGDLTMLPVSCTNGLKDADETDVDCGGGSCPACGTGKGCKKASDCSSLFCANNLCDAPACTDGVRNGDETDVDCGGRHCAGCANGKMCASALDCLSFKCTNGACASSGCTDGKKNDAETDVDCGGGMCPTCAAGKMCLMGTDCAGGMCTNNSCLGSPDMAVADLSISGDLAMCMSTAPAPTAMKLSDPAPVQTAIPNGIALRKDVNAYLHHGVTDKACDILYTGEVGAWKFAIPMINIKSATVVLSAVADDHATPINMYSTRLWSGSCAYDNPAPLPHGVPFDGNPFNNWVQITEPADLKPGASFTVTLSNTSNVPMGDWIAVDWVELRILTQ